MDISPSRPFLSAILASMRLHQWAKNLLVLVPLILNAPHSNFDQVLTFLAGFLLFCLVSSGAYLVNDILDVEADRRHPIKRRRPMAAGDLSSPVAAVIAFSLTCVAVAGAVMLSGTFAVTLLTYLILTLAYSFYLKRIPLVDVLTIAALFTLRIVAGMTLVGEPPSEWLLMFSIFFFLSLSLLKRHAEFVIMDEVGSTVLHGRGYAINDRASVTTFGIASGVASLVVFALFVSSTIKEPGSPYKTPALLWGALPALSYWIMRMWLLTGRGLIADDPVLYALRDRASWILTAVIGAFVIAAQFVKL